MAFNNSNNVTSSSEDQDRKRRERAAAMFGGPQPSANSQFYPFYERVELPIELIDENPDNEYIFGLDNIDELSNAIEDVGFYGSIDVFAKEDGRYEVFAGHRRRLAMIKRNSTTIPSIIYPMPDEIIKAKKLLGSNVQVREITPLKWSRIINYYRENVLEKSGFKGNTITACATFFGKSETTIKRYIAIGNMIPQLQEFADYPLFPYTEFANARSFTKEEQLSLYNSILDFYKKNPDTEVSALYLKQIINSIKARKERPKKEVALPGTKELLVEMQGHVEDESRAVAETEYALSENTIMGEPPLKQEQEIIVNKTHRLSVPLKNYTSFLQSLNLSDYDCSDKETITEIIDNAISLLTSLKETLK